MDEDKDEWRERIDSVVLYDRLEDLRARLKELERIVLAGKDSLRSEYRRHDEMLGRIYAVLFQDPTGQKGLLHDVDVLMGRRRDRDELRGFRWQFWIAVLGFVSAAAVAVITNIDHFKKAFNEKPDKVEMMIENAKHPKNRYHHYVVRQPAEDD